MNMLKLRPFSLSNVSLQDTWQINAFNKETDYLLSLEPDRLLAGFRETAGLDMHGVERYPGWEDLLIGGHTLGHYLTACANCYCSANTDDLLRKKFLEIITQLVNGLRECQTAVGTGFIFGAKILDRNNIELQFDNVESGLTQIFTESWVPWYTLHKIFEGLYAVTGLTDSEVSTTALSIASDLADWVYKRACRWSEELRLKILETEYGGMNDCLYEIYELTGKPEHLKAAHFFDETTLFEKVLAAENSENVLDHLHANTTIPKFLGALRRYTVTGEQRYFDYAEAFWKHVTNNHTYITGDNSEWEHFGPDRILNAKRTNCNCETCNAYNMLKLTRLLFMITGEVRYADWYENTFINTILSSQNPTTGMTTYFQPMAGGYFKVYGERFTKFWCCVGSGMENFSKLQDSFFFRKDGLLVINGYFSCKLISDEISLVQTTDLTRSDTALFTFTKEYSGTIAFRLPEWLAGKAALTVNGIEPDYTVSEGYALITDTFIQGTEIRLTLPMRITVHMLPDSDSVYAFKYGPFVLSARLGVKDMIPSSTGVDVTIPEKRIFEKSFLDSGSEQITVLSGTISEFMENINDNMIRIDEDMYPLSFRLTNTNSRLIFVPHFMQHTERYGIYFDFLDF